MNMAGRHKTSPALVSKAKSMIWLFQFLTLLSCLGPGNIVSQTITHRLPVEGVLGESVTLPLKFSAEEEIQTITWLHNGTSIIFINIVGEQVVVTDPKRKDRLKIIKFSLQINNVTTTDSGLYRAQKTTANSTEFYDYNLWIFRRLSNLQVANHTQLLNGTCKIHLTCSVENPNDLVSFRWQVRGNTILEGANLTITLNPKNSSEEITCVAKNPVSNVSFSFSALSVCKGVFHEKNQHLVILWVVLVTSFIGITVCLFVWRKRIRDFLPFSTQQTWHPAETRRNTVYDPTSPGSTVYAQVTHPNTKTETPKPVNDNDPSTIYAKVCSPNRTTVLDNII